MGGWARATRHKGGNTYSVDMGNFPSMLAQSLLCCSTDAGWRLFELFSHLALYCVENFIIIEFFRLVQLQRKQYLLIIV